MGTYSDPLSTVEDQDQHEQQAVHQYLVSVAVGVTAVVLVLVISLFCLCFLLLKIRGNKKQQRDCEVLRKADVEDPRPDICESLFSTTNVKPKPSPSIFNKDEFLLEELEVVSNVPIHLHEEYVGEIIKSELTYDSVALG